jgi:hypothetical protein
MALREWRRVEATTIEYTVAAASERGGVLVAASGQAASYNTSITPSSVVPIGILLEDIEAQNYMTHPQYYQRNVSDLGSKVGILTKGEVETDMLDTLAEAHISAGALAYLANSGLLTVAAWAPGIRGSNAEQGTSGVLVGRFLSEVDSDGFAKVRIDL